MINKLAKLLRVLTVAPIMALIMLVILYTKDFNAFGSTSAFVMSILFLSIFPLLAYPLQPFIKSYKDKGREGQRSLAMIFSVAGYIGGFLSTLFMHSPKKILLIYLCYLISGALIILFNKLCHLKASGHACGVSGPFTLLVLFGHPIGYLGIIVLLMTWWSSLKIKRHTIWQLFGGTLIPIITLVGLIYIFL